MKKKKSNSGETLVETLIAIAIVVMTILFLATAILTAGRINDKVQAAVSKDLAFHYDTGAGTEKVIPGIPGISEDITVLWHENNGYYYYTQKD